MKKLGLWLASICLIVCSSFAIISCGGGGNDSSSSIVVTQDYVELNKSSMAIEIYTQQTLTATTNVQGEIVWTSSNPSVATVDGGVVNALSVGKTTVTAIAGGVSATCEVTVTGLSAFPVLQLDSTKLEFAMGGDSIFVKATAFYKGGKVDCEFTWESANPSVATVKNGTVTPVGIGETTVTVTTVCLGEILVKEIPVRVSVDEQIQLSKNTLNLKVGQVNPEDISVDTLTFKAFKEGVQITDVTPMVESSDENVAIATVEGNEVTVTAAGFGSCVISVYYDTDEDRIESFVEVNVSPSLVNIKDVLTVEYEGENTEMDIHSLGLIGEFEGVYYNDELVSTDGKFTKDFADNYKALPLDLELRTSVAIYYVRICITIYYLDTTVMVAETGKIPGLYEGDVTAIGFEEGDTVYEHTVTNSDAAWVNRMIPSELAKIGSFDHWIVEFSLDEVPTGSANSGYFITVWIGTSHMVLVKTDMSIYGFTYDEGMPTQADKHAADVCVSLYDAEGKRPAIVEANQKYYLEMHFAHAANADAMFAFNDALNVRLGDSFFCKDAYYQENIKPYRDDTIPTPPEPEPEPDLTIPEVSMGSDHLDMPTYEGDVTELGFPEGTGTVYAVQGKAWTEGDDFTWDSRIILRTDPRLDYIKFDIAFSTATTSFTMWPSDRMSTLGSYSISGNGTITPSADADQNRKIVVVDADGYQATKFEKGKVYTIYIYLNNADTSVQFNAFSDVVLYVTNIECGNGDVTPIIPNIYAQSKASYLPLYKGDVTELGFEEGSVVYENKWNATNTNKTWDNAAYISTNKMTDCLSVEFALSAVPKAGQQIRIYGWWEGGVNGWMASVNSCEVVLDETSANAREVEILDAEGNPVTEWKVNTVYTMKIHHNGAVAVAICFDEKAVPDSTFTVYYNNAIVQTSDSGVDPDPTPDPDPNPDPTPNPNPDDPITQGDDRHAMPIYTGEATDLGFPEGTGTVYQLTTTASTAWADRMIMQVEEGKDYLKFDVVFSAAGKSLTLWPANASTMFGSYSLTASGATTSDADANRTIFIVDKNGSPVTSLNANTLYTVYFYLKSGETNVQVSSFSSVTLYFANIACGDGVVAPVQLNIADNGGTESLFQYKGDVTALGFAEGTTVLESKSVTGKGGTWNDGIKISTDKTKNCLVVNFSFAEVPKEGRNIRVYAWYPGNVSGWIADIVNFEVSYENSYVNQRNLELVDENGNPVTEWKANTVYTLKIYHEGATSVAICIDETTIDKNFAVYYDNNIVQSNDIYSGNNDSSSDFDSSSDSDSSVDSSTDSSVDSSTDSSYDSSVPEENINVSQGDDRHAMPTYSGDATDLGFPEGTGTVYTIECKTWSANDTITWDNRMVMEVEPDAEYVKLDVVFSAAITDVGFWPGGATGTLGYFTISASGVSDSSRKAFIVDQGGYAAASLKANTLYTIYIYYDNTKETNVQLATYQNVTIYAANITCGSGSVNAIVPNVFTQDKAAALAATKGDVTALGFEAGTTVLQLQTTGATWNDAAYVSTDKTTNCLTVNFSFATVPTSGSQIRVMAWYPDTYGWIATILDCASSDAMVDIAKGIEVLDANGNPVTAWEANTVYTLKIYHEGATALAICFDETTVAAGTIVYFDNEIIQNDDTYEAR